MNINDKVSWQDNYGTSEGIIVAIVDSDSSLVSIGNSKCVVLYFKNSDLTLVS